MRPRCPTRFLPLNCCGWFSRDGIANAVDTLSLGDYFVIAAGNSSTQVHALADSVEAKLKEEGVEPVSVEGYRSEGWIILDYASVLVHVFTQQSRDFYDLDRLWSDGIKVDIEYNIN